MIIHGNFKCNSFDIQKLAGGVLCRPRALPTSNEYQIGQHEHQRLNSDS